MSEHLFIYMFQTSINMFPLQCIWSVYAFQVTTLLLMHVTNLMPYRCMQHVM